jgi:hypothetical protein
MITRATPDLLTWHKWLGHVNYASIVSMAKKELASGMPIDLSALPPICEHCVLGKQTKRPVPKIREGERAKEKLEKVYSDITGPEDIGMKYGEKYMLNFIDNASCMSWIYPLKDKSDTVTCFKDWRALVEKEASREVKIFQTDNSSEYTSNDFDAYLQRSGICHEVTAPYTLAQNRRSERCH